jgi:DNA primase
MTYQQERAPLVSVHKLKIKCPVCQHRDNCAVSADWRIAFCRRVKSNRPGRGGWIHILSASVFVTAGSPHRTPPYPSQPIPDQTQTQPASIEHRDAIYCTLLRGGFLSLSTARRAGLHARGLGDGEIVRRGYCDTPTEAQGNEIAAALADYGLADYGQTGYGLAGVPGFYRQGGCWRMVKCAPGYFVPYRDEHGRIQAMQYRLDEPLHGKTKYLWLSSVDRAGGASSGAPVHHACHHLLADAAEVVVTEGALKADVIAYLTQSPVVGVAGVGTFGAHFTMRLQQAAPALRSVVVAYDMDLYHKPEVLQALEALTGQLQRAGLRVRVRTWPDTWKGYDDYLLAQLNHTEVRAA